MTDKGFRLRVLTEEHTAVDEPVTSLVAPGSQGYLGVLRDHANLVTQLDPGMLTVKDLEGKETIYAVSGGFLEVSRNVATVLADALESAEAIEVARAEAAQERARQRILARESGVDIARAELALKRAVNRIKVAREGH